MKTHAQLIADHEARTAPLLERIEAMTKKLNDDQERMIAAQYKFAGKVLGKY